MADTTGVAENNPLRQALPRTRVPDPCTVVLFGATGDLTHRKLAPALYRLAVEGQLPAEYAIIGFARRDWSDDAFREEIRKTLQKEGGSEFDATWPAFGAHLAFIGGEFNDASCFTKLKERLDELDR